MANRILFPTNSCALQSGCGLWKRRDFSAASGASTSKMYYKYLQLSDPLSGSASTASTFLDTTTKREGRMGCECGWVFRRIRLQNVVQILCNCYPTHQSICTVKHCTVCNTAKYNGHFQMQPGFVSWCVRPSVLISVNPPFQLVRERSPAAAWYVGYPILVYSMPIQ